MKKYVRASDDSAFSGDSNDRAHYADSRNNLDADPGTLEVLTYDPDPWVRRCAATHPNTPALRVRELIDDDELYVAEAAIRHSSLSDEEKYEAFWRLYDYGCEAGWAELDPEGDIYPDIIDDICLSPCFKESDMPRLIKEVYWDQISWGLSGNPSVSGDVLRDILDAVERGRVNASQEWDILYRLAENPNTPNDVLHGVVKYTSKWHMDPDAREPIILAAKHNPNYSEGGT